MNYALVFDSLESGSLNLEEFKSNLEKYPNLIKKHKYQNKMFSILFENFDKGGNNDILYYLLDNINKNSILKLYFLFKDEFQKFGLLSYLDDENIEDIDMLITHLKNYILNRDFIGVSLILNANPDLDINKDCNLLEYSLVHSSQDIIKLIANHKNSFLQNKIFDGKNRKFNIFSYSNDELFYLLLSKYNNVKFLLDDLLKGGISYLHNKRIIKLLQDDLLIFRYKILKKHIIFDVYTPKDEMKYFLNTLYYKKMKKIKRINLSFNRILEEIK